MIPSIRTQIGFMVLLLGAGCGVDVRALPAEGLVLIDEGRAVVADQSGISVLVEPTEVPWADDEAVGFFVEITNRCPDAIEVRLEDFVLIDAQGRRRLPESPRQLIDSFRSAHGNGETGRHVLVSGYGWGQSYGWYGYPYGYDIDQEYYERLERSKYLSRLLLSRVVSSNEIVGGNVTFLHQLQKEEELTLDIVLHRRIVDGSSADREVEEAGSLSFRFPFVVE